MCIFLYKWLSLILNEYKTEFFFVIFTLPDKFNNYYKKIEANKKENL